MKLSVIIPAYNESKRIIPTLKDIYDYLSKQDYNYEVLIVNDGSRDDTAQVVKQLIKKWPEFHLVDNAINKGKGAVVRQGMLLAQGSWRLFMDADNATRIKELDGFWPYTKNYDLIIASRYIKGAKITAEQPLIRKALSRAGNILTQLLIAWGIQDTQCGFKLFSSSATEKIFKKQTMERWSFDMELIAIAKKYNLKIKELPVEWREAGNSRLKVARTSIRTLKDLFKIKWNLIIGKY